MSECKDCNTPGKICELHNPHIENLDISTKGSPAKLANPNDGESAPFKGKDTDLQVDTMGFDLQAAGETPGAKILQYVKNKKIQLQQLLAVRGENALLGKITTDLKETVPGAAQINTSTLAGIIVKYLIQSEATAHHHKAPTPFNDSQFLQEIEPVLERKQASMKPEIYCPNCGEEATSTKPGFVSCLECNYKGPDEIGGGKVAPRMKNVKASDLNAMKLAEFEKEAGILKNVLVSMGIGASLLSGLGGLATMDAHQQKAYASQIEEAAKTKAEERNSQIKSYLSHVERTPEGVEKAKQALNKELSRINERINTLKSAPVNGNKDYFGYALNSALLSTCNEQKDLVTEELMRLGDIDTNNVSDKVSALNLAKAEIKTALQFTDGGKEFDKRLKEYFSQEEKETGKTRAEIAAETKKQIEDYLATRDKEDPKQASLKFAAAGGANEEEEEEPEEEESTLNSSVVSLLESCKTEWTNLGEPVNPGTWPKEIERAVLALNDSVIKAIESIQGKLVEGEYYIKNVDEGVDAAGGGSDVPGMSDLNIAPSEPETEEKPIPELQTRNNEKMSNRKEAAIEVTSTETKKALKFVEGLQDRVADIFFEYKKTVETANNSALVKSGGEDMVRLKSKLSEIEKVLDKQFTVLETAEEAIDDKKKTSAKKELPDFIKEKQEEAKDKKEEPKKEEKKSGLSCKACGEPIKIVGECKNCDSKKEKTSSLFMGLSLVGIE